MRLVDIEKDIKNLIEEDINNPEVYNKIEELSYLFLMRNHLMSTGKSAADVAQLIASDLYLKICNGKEIISWIGYINRSYHAYIREYNKINKSEVINTEGDYDLETGIINMSMSSTASNVIEFNRVIDNEYFDNLPKIVDGIMKKSKYREFTGDYNNARLSIVLSLSAGKFINYGMSTAESMYVRMLYSLTKDKILHNINEGKDNRYTGGLTLMQLFTLSNANIASTN